MTITLWIVAVFILWAAASFPLAVLICRRLRGNRHQYALRQQQYSSIMRAIVDYDAKKLAGHA